jgi:hypothetical protein
MAQRLTRNFLKCLAVPRGSNGRPKNAVFAKQKVIPRGVALRGNPMGFRRWTSARNSVVICRNISVQRSADRLSAALSNSAIKAADTVAAIVSLVLPKLHRMPVDN